MSNKKQNQRPAKQSNRSLSSVLLKTLTKALQSGHATVSYVFVHKKLKNIHTENKSDQPITLEEEDIKSVLHTNLGPACLNIKDKSPEDLYNMLQDTKHDLGAAYFVLD